MAVLRMQFSKLLFILFVIGFIANDVNGDCPRPVFTNPYAITFEPDQQAYSPDSQVVFDCEEGHTPNGLPNHYYCQNDSTWDLDISDGRCYAQCNTTELISDDDVKVTDDSGVQQTVFSHGENATFACNNKSQLSGAEHGTCNNGTFELENEPSCLIYCPRPVFTNPYAIVLNPDQQSYVTFSPIVLGCEEGHTPSGFPAAIYCYDDGNWDTDVSGGRCNAQCNTTKLIPDHDVKATTDDGVQQTVFNHGENANFACNNKSQLSGAEHGTCNNGTFEYENEPSCLAYCPVYLEELGEGLYYDIADEPVINETNTLYYRDGDVITYRCSDGYEGPKKRTPSDDGTSTCIDGLWDPPGIPTCMVMTTAEMMTTMELPTSMEMTTIADQSTIATTTTKASTTEGLPTSLPNSTPPLATPMTPTDSSTTSVIPPGLTTVTPDATTITPDLTTVASGVTTVTPDARTTTPDSTTVGSGLTTVTPDARTTTLDSTTVGSSLTTVTPDATTVTPDSTTVGSGVTTVTPDATTTTLDSTTVGSGLITVTPDATSITPGLTTVTPDATTVTPDAMTITPDSTTVGSGLTTVTPDATSITPGLTTVTPDATTVTPDATTATPAISTETAPPTVPESTTKSDSTTSSPTESQETTASQKTSTATPERTEKPPTTPLPCGGECKATQLCNAENKCECRPDYYEDEGDTENPCKEPKSFDVTIKITEVNNTNAEYNVELEDPSSPEFKKLEIGVCEPFEEIYKNDTEYKGCRVLEFSNGSIIVNYVLTFAENSVQSASTVNTTVQQELQNPNGSFTGAYAFDDSSLVVAPLDECIKKIDDCDPENANCTDQGADGYSCECREGFDDVGGSNSLPGRKCMESTEPYPTEPQPTEPQPTDPRTTEEPEEPGVEPWKIVVGVTVPIIAIIIVGLACWQYRRLHRTSTSVVTKSHTIQYSDDTSGSSDPEAVKPGSITIMNDYGTVQEVVLPLDDIPLKEESNFVSDKD